ncbi:MAG TPA: NAD-dependent epimerase/dehydratase family protein [Lactovum miscens]|uniref:NAD-dependent epimerase/dehydratase family protein n=1 Tax=Lactovum miscens TaxID=190387 RepID=UPI002ED9C571
MNILVTGGSGFIGKNLIKSLAQNKSNRILNFDKFSSPEIEDLSNVTFLKGDFNIDYNIDKVVTNIDVLYHLISTSVPSTAGSLQHEIIQNLLPSINLFQSAVNAKVKKIVFLSSGGTVYGDDSQGNPHHEDDKNLPINTYGLQKLYIEQSLEYITRNTETKYSIIRLSNPYGPGQNPNAPIGLVTKLVYQSINDLPIHVFGDGGNVRDYIFIDDAIKGIEKIVSSGEENTIYNLGNGQGFSINDVISEIQKVTDKKLNIVMEPDRGIDVRVSILDIEKYRQIKEVESTSLFEGIKKTKEHLMEHN